MKPTRLRRGANAIEFAFTLPILFTMLASVMEYGFFYAREMSFRHATYRALRAAAGTAMDSDPEARFRSELDIQLTALGFDPSVVTATAAVSGAWGERSLDVSTSTPWGGLTGLLPHPGTLGATMQARTEDQEPIDTGP